MYRCRILNTTLSAVLSFGAAGAVLADVDQNENGGEAAAVLEANTSISQAIELAEQRTGGKAVQAGIEKHSGVWVYTVSTSAKNGLTDISVDPSSGRVMEAHGESKAPGSEDESGTEDFAKLADATTTLASAIDIAERHSGGKVIEARIENDDGAMRFNIQLARDHALREVVVDARSGKVVSVANAADIEERDED